MLKEFRNAVGGMFGRTRKNFLQQIPTPGLKRLARRSVFYTVYPRPGKPDKRRGPQDVLGVFHMTSSAPAGHELGGRIQSRNRLMPVPIGALGKRIAKLAKIRNTSRLDIETALRARNRDLVILPRGDRFIAYARPKKRPTRPSLGNARRRRRSGGKEPKLVPVFAFVPNVTLQARLGLRRTWNSLRGDRVRRVNEAVAKAIETLNRG